MRTFRRLPDKLQRQVQRKTLRKAAVIVRDAARQYAPIDTGRLYDSIRIRGLRKKRRMQGQVGVEVRAEVYYAKYVEFGSSKQPPDPFMTRAADDTGHRVPKVFSSNLQADINAALRKAR